MKILKWILGIILTLILIGVVLTLIGPKNYSVKRTKKINASAAVAYDQIRLFKNWKSWSPWEEMDPAASYTIDGEDGVIGTKYAWSGEITGAGTMTIKELDTNTKILHDLVFTEPMEDRSISGFDIEAIDSNSCTVTWHISGDIGPSGRAFLLLSPMDKQIGPSFERGLVKMDSILSANRNN